MRQGFSAMRRTPMTRSVGTFAWMLTRRAWRSPESCSIKPAGKEDFALCAGSAAKVAKLAKRAGGQLLALISLATLAALADGSGTWYGSNFLYALMRDPPTRSAMRPDGAGRSQSC